LKRRLFLLGIALGFGLGSLPAADVPRNAPELAVQMGGGRQLLLSQYRGKVVLLEFLHTTCPHCQQSSALIQQLSKEFGPRGFQPVGIAFNDNAAALVPEFVRQLGLTFPVGSAPRDTVIQYLHHPMAKPLYVPQMIFVDRKGVIREQHGGEDDYLKNLEPNLRASIETLLQQPVRAHRRATSKAPGAAKKTSATAAASQSLR
jgi:peroxiredoxin